MKFGEFNLSSGIYCVENKINGKKYVGQGVLVEKRMTSNHKECKVLYDAINKYGIDNYIEEIRNSIKIYINSLERN